jgi:hypothetical protein
MCAWLLSTQVGRSANGAQTTGVGREWMAALSNRDSKRTFAPACVAAVLALESDIRRRTLIGLIFPL